MARRFCSFLSAADCSASEKTTTTKRFISVSIADLRSKLLALLKIQGHGDREAIIIAETLMFAELRSNNQGIIKLIAGALKPNTSQGQEIALVHETPLSAKIDGSQRQGMVR